MQIRAKREIDELEFDIAEMKIDKVLSCESIFNYTYKSTNDINELELNINADRLIVKFAKKLTEGGILNLVIKYSAGYRYVNDNLVITKPRSGFHFVEYDEFHRRGRIQAWIQGESTESKY